MFLLDLNIEHQARYPWQFVEGSLCTLRIKCNEPAASVEVKYGDPFWFIGGNKLTPQLYTARLERKQQVLDDTYYSITLKMDTHKLRYHFIITLEDGRVVYLSDSGVTAPVGEEFLRPFQVSYVFAGERYSAPGWAKDMVWYQIFPERFSRTDENRPGFVPDRENRYGGTLKGIEKNIPHLAALGVQGVYLNPIFASPSNHRYDTEDYSRIDPMLGTEQDFADLVAALHEKGIRVMLDGVYNHCAWNNPYWQDVVKNGKTSRYYDWFFVSDTEYLKNTPLSGMTADSIRHCRPFECFAFAANMPKWNTTNREVIEHLVSQAQAWTRKYHIDAWRLDVPDETGIHFLSAFRSGIRSVDPEAYIIGEIWGDPAWWIDRAVFDGTMDYPLYFAVKDFVMKGADSISTFARRLGRYYMSMPDGMRRNQFGFCANHDIPRTLTMCGGSEALTEKAVFITLLFGGGFSVYYGDELGMTGGEDPDNRGAMTWANRNEKLYEFYRSAVELKKTTLPSLELESLSCRDNAVFASFTGGYTAIITENGGSLRLPENTVTVFGNVTAEADGQYIHDYALLKDIR